MEPPRIDHRTENRTMFDELMSNLNDLFEDLTRELQASVDALNTLNLVLAAQVLQDGEAAEAAARRIREVVRDGTSHQCMPGMFEDGGA
jgi:hypothetical protein